MNKNLQIGATILTTALIAPQYAMADSFSNLGYNLAKSSIKSAWSTFGRDCDKVDDLIGIAGRSTERAKRKMRSMSSGVENFASGFVSGMMEALGVVVEHCGEECTRVGSEAAVLAAVIFCEASEIIGHIAEFDGLKDRDNIGCGEPYKMSCESSFISYAESQCSQYASGNDFERYYSASRNGCCSYDPSK